MQTSNESQIKVTIVRMGRDAQQEVTLSEGATVADAFAATGQDYSELTREVFCDGVKTQGHFEVDNGDVLYIVADKVTAGQLDNAEKDFVNKIVRMTSIRM